jgi:hypothetical protein
MDIQKLFIQYSIIPLYVFGQVYKVSTFILNYNPSVCGRREYVFLYFYNFKNHN